MTTINKVVPVFTAFDNTFTTFAFERALALSGMSEVVPLQTVLDEAMEQRMKLPRDKRRNGWTQISVDGKLLQIMNDVADFFRVGGVLARVRGREVVTGWLQPMIVGETGGLIATMWERHDDPEKDVFWLRIKAEPGNEGIIVPINTIGEHEPQRLVNERRVELKDGNMQTNALISTAFQGSQGNIAAHNVPLAKLISTLDITWDPIPEDGGRFLRKVNREAAVEITEDTFAEAVHQFPDNTSDFFGATRPVVREAMRRGWMNAFAKRGVGMVRF